jgi:hypothetical protein
MQIKGGFVFQIRHGVTGELHYATQQRVPVSESSAIIGGIKRKIVREYEIGWTGNLAKAARLESAEMAAAAFATFGMLGTVNLKFDIVELKPMVARRSYRPSDVLSIRSAADVLDPLRAKGNITFERVSRAQLIVERVKQVIPGG